MAVRALHKAFELEEGLGEGQDAVGARACPALETAPLYDQLHRCRQFGSLARTLCHWQGASPRCLGERVTSL